MKEPKEIKFQKYYNFKGSLKDQESLLSGDIGDFRSILSSSKSPYPK